MCGGSVRYTKIQCRECNSIIVYCYYIHYICSCCFCREAGFTNIAQRLIEVQYELTDRLTYYLCGRRPGYLLPVLVSLQVGLVDAFLHFYIICLFSII